MTKPLESCVQPSTCHKARLHRGADRASRKHVAPDATTFTYLFLPLNTAISYRWYSNTQRLREVEGMEINATTEEVRERISK